MILEYYVRREIGSAALCFAILATCLCPLALAHDTAVAETPQSEAWTPLFNSHNLDGWHICVEHAEANTDPEHIIQVEDGAIHIYKDQKAGKPVKRAYFATDANYSYYHLRFQYKWGTKKFAPRTKRKRDAGLMYHLTGPEVVWPQVRRMPGTRRRRRRLFCRSRDAGCKRTSTGSRSRRTSINTAALPKAGSKPTVASLGSARVIKEGTFEVDGWNTVEVFVHGDNEVIYIVNGHPVFRGTKLARLGDDNKTWEPLPAGRIAFQAEYAEVFYRNIEIQPIAGGPLQPAASNRALPDKPAAPATPADTTKTSAGYQRCPRHLRFRSRQRRRSWNIRLWPALTIRADFTSAKGPTSTILMTCSRKRCRDRFGGWKTPMATAYSIASQCLPIK